MRRLIVLGASNLTRGFGTVVDAASAAWGGAHQPASLEVFAALGHGRSYGMSKTVLFRRLPGILESALWDQLERLPRVPTRALVTDVGNDILYGAPVARILEWVDECVDRLTAVGSEVTLTDLPLASIRTLSPARFKLFRSVLVPSCRLSLGATLERAREVNEGLVGLARSRSLTLAPLKPHWYGLDPIHIRPRYWSEAWREILLAGTQASTFEGAGPGAGIGSARLYLAAPEQRWILGIEQRRRQPAIRKGGLSVWLY